VRARCHDISVLDIGAGLGIDYAGDSPLVPEVLVHGDDVSVIRRRQSYDEVIDLDTPLCEITSAGCEGSH
jgi:hypothetical protein